MSWFGDLKTTHYQRVNYFSKTKNYENYPLNFLKDKQRKHESLEGSVTKNQVKSKQIP